MDDFGLSSLLGLKFVSSWKDAFIEGSFRGVKFHVERTNNDGGRRLVKHEFPEKDFAVIEDMRRHPSLMCTILMCSTRMGNT